MSSAEETPDDLVLTPKRAALYIVVITALFIFIDDLLGLLNGGGIFSVWEAMRSTGAGAAAVAVDGAGLRTLFIALASVFVLLPLAFVRADLANKFVSGGMVLVIVGGGFILDGIFDERLVGGTIVARGYIRCEKGDFHVGNGKGRVWFDDYVAHAANCPPVSREL